MKQDTFILAQDYKNLETKVIYKYEDIKAFLNRKISTHIKNYKKSTQECEFKCIENIQRYL